MKAKIRLLRNHPHPFIGKHILFTLCILFLQLASVAQLHQIRYSNTATFAMDFFNSQTGALSHYDTLFITNDNGNTWTEKLQRNGQFTDIQFENANTLFANSLKATPAFYDRMVYKSNNNGNTWDSVLVGSAISNYQKLVIRNSDEVVSYDQTSDSFKVSNFNTHTTSTRFIQAGARITKLQFINQDTAIALLTELIDSVNYAGNVILKQSTNGGNTWTTLWTVYDNLYAVQADFADYAHGCIRVDSTFFYTANAGINWSSFNANASMTYNTQLQMISPDVAYCFHDYGLLRVNMPSQSVSYLALDSIPYVHDWVYADFLDDYNWFIAENILSCGIAGSKIWRLGGEHNPTGVNTFNASNSINIYPNPTKGLFTIDLGNPIESDTDLQLTDLNGKVIWQNRSKEKIIHLDISKFAKGTYILKCETGNKIFSNKIILR